MNTTWIKAASALLVLIGTIWVGASTMATKAEVKDVEAEVTGKVVIVQNSVDRHIVDDNIFYANRRIWQIKEQTGSQECRHVTQTSIKDECMRLELKIDSLQKQREALNR